MSYVYVSAALRGCFGINPSAKLVLLILAEHANEDSGGVAWPSVATIARLAGLSERQVQVHLTKLIGQGWIFTTSRRGGGAGNTTRYQLNFARMRAVQQRNGEAGNTHSESEEGEARRTKGEAERQKGCRPPHPNRKVTRNQRNPRATTTWRRSNREPEGLGTNLYHPNRKD